MSAECASMACDNAVEYVSMLDTCACEKDQQSITTNSANISACEKDQQSIATNRATNSACEKRALSDSDRAKLIYCDGLVQTCK